MNQSAATCLFRRKLIITAVVIAVTIFINCAATSSSKVILSPDYKKHPLINAALALVILDTKPLVIYQGSVQRALGHGDAEELARQFFQKRLLSDLSKEVDLKEVFAQPLLSKYLVTKEVVNRADETVTVEIPTEGTRFDFGSNKADLVLFLSGIRIGTETDEYYQSRVDYGFNPSVGRHLVYISNFVLWDNRTQNYICYGRVKSLVPIREKESVVSEWEEVSKQFVHTIFEPTGFLKRAKSR